LKSIDRFFDSFSRKKQSIEVDFIDDKSLFFLDSDLFEKIILRVRKIDSSRSFSLKTLFPANVSDLINFELFVNVTSKIDLRNLLAFAFKTLNVL